MTILGNKLKLSVLGAIMALGIFSGCDMYKNDQVPFLCRLLCEFGVNRFNRRAFGSTVPAY